ncbi:acylamide-delta3(E)-desaturase [Hortaea werneckii]|nr:acylamide-delta3(E)-desaturase [Hortaea werneckii]KAI7559808.1 acylamide-delta3(E)-desaturase [Hortaea werneckii]KAI7615894.1 acylamide-delta3(E)-desaturase [Hortaea werneckii]
MILSGILNSSWAWLDKTFPYVLEPLMGHTWDSYYYHHVKHHHVEGNGPGDLSSTIRYQRDDIGHFLHYVGRFMFFIWLELPLYFMQRKKYNLGVRAFLSEISSYAFMYGMWRWNPKPATFVFLLPFFLLRIGLMVGNWGQHALVDEVEPNSDYRSSITLIDVPSNRYSFNDGYHTAHHLNPRRHWREHPTHFLQSKTTYAGNGALVFTNIDYIMLTITLLRKDYMYLADRLVPIGDQIGMSKVEIANMLKTKTRAFTEADIKKRFK